MDLGETWVKDGLGRSIKLYCFAMVLSYSRYKYVEWSDKPFTAATFVNAHIRAFEYFGGIPKEIVYDQDRLVVAVLNGFVCNTTSS